MANDIIQQLEPCKIGWIDYSIISGDIMAIHQNFSDLQVEKIHLIVLSEMNLIRNNANQGLKTI
jgi:hypothetical protein